MVYNGYEYLAEFILYHRNLADHIFLIDHNSAHNLRDLETENVTIFRSNHEAQFQSECTNIVIEKYAIKDNFDWLFVLDIDEFLPFSQREEFQSFLHKHKNDQALQFQWRNGVPFYDTEKETPDSLIECPSIRFFHKHSIHCKTGVNINATRKKFFIPTGAHHISKITPDWFRHILVLKNRKTYKAKTLSIPLLHIVAFNKNTFIEKIKNYVKQMGYREHVVGQSGGVVRNYPDKFSGDEWLWYIANFRVSSPNDQQECHIDLFLEEDIFAHLNTLEVQTLKSKIQACAPTTKKAASKKESAYLKHKSDDRDVINNIKWFDIITDTKEIISITPNAPYNKK